MLILVTGSTGRVGRHFIAGLLDDPRFSKARIRALCHNRLCDETERVGVIHGSITRPLPFQLAGQQQGEIPAGLAANYDLEMLIDLAWQYERSKEEPRIVWYPG